MEETICRGIREALFILLLQCDCEKNALPNLIPICSFLGMQT